MSCGGFLLALQQACAVKAMRLCVPTVIVLLITRFGDATATKAVGCLGKSARKLFPWPCRTRPALATKLR